MFFLLFLLFILNTHSITLPSSCKDLQDGYHWLKFAKDTLDTTYPPVHQKCSNGHLIIDVNHDKNIKNYFTSFEMYHYALGGPNQMDGVNWENWLTIETNSHLLSPKCSICDDKNIDLNEHLTKTSYYMTGTMFGCLTTHKAERDCSWNWDTYQCKYCTLKDTDGDLGYHTMYKTDNEYSTYLNMKNELLAGDKSLYIDEDGRDNSWQTLQIGLCGVYPLASDQKATALNRDECFGFVNTYQPSIGTDGRYCQCVGIDSDTTYDIDESTLNKYKQLLGDNKSTNNIEYDTTKIYNLYQKHFQKGTYRILNPGIYNIMEDITYDFNPGTDINNPNSANDDSWWPNIKQKDIYPGAYDTRDEYFMGFWAGISIESDNVTLNLNGFTLQMSKSFYYQQRFFTNVAIKSFVFSLNQGPGIFGSNPKFPNNIIIKNGIIGLSSHHGIHGHGNSNVTIENIHVKDFETHGIEMSSFNNITIKNVEIGPSSNIAYLNGEYGYARFTLQRLDRIIKDDNKFIGKDMFPIKFSGREVEVGLSDIIEKLRGQMNMAFKYVMGVEKYDANNEEWLQAKKLFINDDGIPYGAVMYGLFLNLYFANVFQIHPSMKHSKNATIENLIIHDLVHKTREYIRLDKYHDTPYSNPYNAGFNAISLLGEDIINQGYGNQDWTQVKYKGDALIDAHIAMDIATDDWGEKQLLFIDDKFRKWALGQYSWTNDDYDGHPYIGCNGDRMTHVNKGTIGIRMDGVENITFTSLNIHHLFEKSPLGSDKCSEYWDGNMQKFYGTGHFLQNAPYLYGYTGNMLHGIFSDWSTYELNKCNLSNFESDTGPVKGIGAYINTHINITNSLNIYSLHSGTKLNNIDTSLLNHPYAPTISKPIHIVSEWKKLNKIFKSDINNIGNNQISYKCIYGKDGINDDYFEYNELIKMSDCKDERGYWVAILAAVVVLVSCVLIIGIYFCYDYLCCCKNCVNKKNGYSKLSQNDDDINDMEYKANYGTMIDYSDDDIY